MEGKEERKEEVIRKKRGRRPKGEKRQYELNKDQTKFFVDLSNEIKSQEIVFNLLEKANLKEFGSEVSFKDIVIYALGKITDKDIEKLKDNSLSEMEKVERTLFEYNQKHKENLSLGEFLIKKLNIN